VGSSGGLNEHQNEGVRPLGHPNAMVNHRLSNAWVKSLR
jgi:hypothetical protein